MNTWQLSGNIEGHGIKGKKFPTMWIAINLPLTKLGIDRPNKVFVTLDIDPSTTSTNGRLAEHIKHTISKDKFIVAHECLVTGIPFSKKKDDGEWETIHKPGLKTTVRRISLLDRRPEEINVGLIQGKVVTHSKDKIIVEDRYRIPSTGEWKSRNIPLLLPRVATNSLVGKSILAQAQACGVTPEGESKFFGLVEKFMILQ